MDETANGVREQLVQWFARDVAHTGKSPFEVADAILARFEVTAKPVVTDAVLGAMVNEAALCCGPGVDAVAGQRLLNRL